MEGAATERYFVKTSTHERITAMSDRNNRLEFCRILLLELAPDEVDFLVEYDKAARITGPGERLGPEFGVADTAIVLGPVVVMIGQRVFDLILSWAGEIAQKIVEGFIVDQGKAELKAWLSAPKENNISGALTSAGKVEIITVVSRLATEAKLPDDEIERVIKHVAKIVFGDDPEH